VVAGIKTEGWVSASQKMRFQALALGMSTARPRPTPLQVQAIARITTTTRKRMVGGFYSYDNQTEHQGPGHGVHRQATARGLLLCEANSTRPVKWNWW
jgi:hypothetical protein